MSEKKYLLTLDEMILFYYRGFYDGAMGGDARPYPSSDWLESHEYHERTCHMIDNGVELCCSTCDRRHAYDDEPDYCTGCGAKVATVK